MAYVKTNWLNAATTLQATEPEELIGLFRFATEVVVTGNPASFLVRLEGSLNGSSWFTLAELSNPVSASWNDVRPTKLVRFNLIDLTGGTSPTVTASMMAQEVPA